MESGERLRPGDIAVTTDERAGYPLLGPGVVVIIASESPDVNNILRAYRFPLGNAQRHSIAADWLELLWRPDATAE